MTIIQLTPAAIQHIKNNIQTKVQGSGIRISVKKTGCSGFAYVVEMADSGIAGDISQVADPEVTIYIDPACVAAIQGSTLDYVQQGLNQKFVFQNPNEKGSCGCGESFTI